MDEMMNPLAHVVGTAVVASAIIQFLKWLPWFPWLKLQGNSDKVNRIAAVIAAVAGASGIKLAIDGSLAGGGHLALDWPSTKIMYDGVTHVGLQLIVNQLAYAHGIKPFFSLTGATTNEAPRV